MGFLLLVLGSHRRRSPQQRQRQLNCLENVTHAPMGRKGRSVGKVNNETTQYELSSRIEVIIPNNFKRIPTPRASKYNGGLRLKVITRILHIDKKSVDFESSLIDHGESTGRPNHSTCRHPFHPSQLNVIVNPCVPKTIHAHVLRKVNAMNIHTNPWAPTDHEYPQRSMNVNGHHTCSFSSSAKVMDIRRADIH